MFAATTPAAPAESYADYYHDGNVALPPVVHKRLAEIVAGMAPFRLTNRWLDVGCGAGALLEAAVAGGWEAAGTEVAPVAVERLGERGLTVLQGELTNLALPEGEYDVVTLIEVIEHVADPLSVARRAAELLRPGGVAFLTTPHARGISARLLGMRWTLVAPPEHLQLFSRAGLRALLARAGLEVASNRAEGVNPYELLRMVRRREAQHGLERVEAAYDLNTALQRRRAGRLARALLNATLSVTGLGDGLKCRAIRPQDDHSGARAARMV